MVVIISNYSPLCPYSIGLGTLLSGSRIISDGMLQAAAEWYFSYILSELALEMIFPTRLWPIRVLCTKELLSVFCTKETIPYNLRITKKNS